jgi:hypothetical protein
VETRASGSEGGPGKRVRLKGRHRALVRPYERAVVFSFDEKNQCQALDRTQASLPMKRGRAGTMTHDPCRHGTTDLLAAMNIGTGEVLYDCRQHHKSSDVLAFFKLIDLHVPTPLGGARRVGLIPRDNLDKLTSG